MGKVGEMIASGSTRTADYAARLVKDIAARDFSRYARPGGVLVKSNHPAFVIGHLAVYPCKVMDALGLPRGATEMPASYDALFKATAECVDDPECRIYPPMEELTKRYFEGNQAALAAIRETVDEKLIGPNPVEGRMRELFPQLGAMLIFYMGPHAHGHLGQLSAWRRAMGMPAA